MISGHLKTITLQGQTINKISLLVQEVKREQQELQKSNKQKLLDEEVRVN